MRIDVQVVSISSVNHTENYIERKNEQFMSFHLRLKERGLRIKYEFFFKLHTCSVNQVFPRLKLEAL